MKKVLCLTIVLCQLALLMACGGKDTASPDSTVPGTTDAPVTEEVLEEPEFDGADFSGKTFKVMEYVGDKYDVIFADLDAGEVMSRVITERNDHIRDKFGINVKVEYAFPVMDVALKAINAGQCDFHLICDSTYSSVPAAIDGKLYDISDLEQVNTKAAYWAPSVAESLTVADTMFLAANYSNPSFVTDLPAVFFKKELLKKEELESPYDLVREDRWTVDKYIEMITSCYADLNENGEVDKDDRVGLYSTDYTTDVPILFKYIYDDDRFHVSKDGVYTTIGYTEKTLSLFEKYDSISKSLNYLHYDDIHDPSMPTIAMDPVWIYGSSAAGMLKDDATLFTEQTLEFCDFLDMDEGQFGFCPLPDLYGKGEWYAKNELNMTVMSVPRMVEDPDMVGTILEYTAYEGMKVQLPSYYELLLGEKTEATTDNYEMMDEIIDRISVDGISLYVGEDIIDREGMFVTGNFESIWKRVQPVADAKLNEIIEKLKEAGA